MTLELNRAVVNFNSVPIPGVFRNGTFIGETPIESFILFRSGAFASSQTKSFTVDFPCKPRTVMVSDTNSDTTYTFTVTTPEGAIWTMNFAANNASQVTSYGQTKLINFPAFVLTEGTKVAINTNKNLSLLVFFANLSFNVDVKDF